MVRVNVRTAAPIQVFAILLKIRAIILVIDLSWMIRVFPFIKVYRFMFNIVFFVVTSDRPLLLFEHIFYFSSEL